MRQIGIRIIEENINEKTLDVKERKTARAVIINNKKQVLMMYSKMFDDYTFPGGGVKQDESLEMALKRELEEETGAIEINIIEPYGFTEELRYGIKGSNQVYLQTSYYYICMVQKFDSPKLMDREIDQGLEIKWVDIDLAITQNLKVHPNALHQKKGLKTVLIRDNMVLESLKEVLK